MSRPVVIVLALFVLAALASCNKTTRTTFSSGPSLLIPWDMDTLTPPFAASVIDGHSRVTANGLLVACKISGALTDTSGNTHLYTRSWEAAMFLDGSRPGFTAGIDTVEVNSTFLADTSFYLFLHSDTTTIWNDGSLNHWYVAGTDSIPTISVDIPGTMPVFTGILPASISRSADFSFTFNSSNTVDGDSAFVTICGHAPSAFAQSNVVSVNGGTATIAASELHQFNNASSYYLNWSTVGPAYSGGYIIFTIYNHSTLTIGGKQFAFVKQREFIGIVTFF
jgi:hypothetical protein